MVCRPSSWLGRPQPVRAALCLRSFPHRRRGLQLPSPFHHRVARPNGPALPQTFCCGLDRRWPTSGRKRRQKWRTEFTAYEYELDRARAGKKMIALCTYPLYASRAVMETRDSSWKPRSWCCGISSTFFGGARHDFDVAQLFQDIDRRLAHHEPARRHRAARAAPPLCPDIILGKDRMRF
jgi:hypothetical protein